VSATTIQPYHGSYLMPGLEHATVSDAMHPGILSCGADATLIDVARLMTTHHVHCVAVMGISHDGPGEKLVWGIISDLDLLRAGIRTRADQPAGAIALQPIISVEPTMALRDAGELMLANGATHVVVVDPELQRPIGILSTLDIAGVFAWGGVSAAALSRGALSSRLRPSAPIARGASRRARAAYRPGSCRPRRGGQREPR
jgi:CBS domain-containing protein